MNGSTREAVRFSYEPLNSDAKEIRLLALLPGSPGKPILSRMRHLSLGEDADTRTETYEALSYAWGSADVTHRIHINGIPFRIRQNLHRALLQLRLQNAERVLWIDAICINQNDVRERNHQVRQMGDIYSRASTVLVWLGPSTSLSKKAITFMRESKGIRFTSFAPYESQYLGVRDLCMRSYWRRVWIIQEIGLARNLQIICGTEQVSWDNFSRFLLNVSNSKAAYTPKAVQSIRSSHAVRILEQRSAYQNQRCTLWKLLRDFADSLCAIPHDKVYGVLGLASDSGPDDLSIDYSIPLKELHKDVISLYNKNIQNQRVNETETNSKMPDIVSFSSFLSRRLGILGQDYFPHTTRINYSSGLIPLSPSTARTLIRVESTMLGVITMVGEVQKGYGGSSHWFEISDHEPRMKDDAYFGKFLARPREIVTDVPVRLNKSAQCGMPLRAEEKLYLEILKQGARPLTYGPVTDSMFRNVAQYTPSESDIEATGHRWLKATNDLRGIGHGGVQIGDLLYTLSKHSRKIVIRPAENEYIIVGTAILEFDFSTHDRRIQHSLPNPPGPLPPPPPPQMDLYLDVETLQILTVI